MEDFFSLHRARVGGGEESYAAPRYIDRTNICRYYAVASLSAHVVENVIGVSGVLRTIVIASEPSNVSHINCCLPLDRAKVVWLEENCFMVHGFKIEKTCPPYSRYNNICRISP